ncbi:MAG: hypothetical protein ACI8TQ_000274 [Planctomycetota bacterium]|jgi:hypothetical protein
MAECRTNFKRIALNHLTKFLLSTVGCLTVFGCANTPTETPAPGLRPGLLNLGPVDRVTQDIQDGIEAHVKEQSKLGEGVFKLEDGEQTLDLKLVRVHTEYLSKLGPQRHFACVDLATANGHVYDVDFFMDGEPGSMKVSETTIHKRNGQPRYVWEQAADKTWARVAADTATPKLLGVIEGRDRFEFTYRATLPKLEGPAQVWLPLATSDAYQTIEVTEINAPGEQAVLEDAAYGNRILHLTLGPDDGNRDIVVTYTVERFEKAAYPDRELDRSKHLAPERLVPDTEEFRTIAASVCEGKDGDLVKARALYDHVIDHMRYAKIGTEYGKGDAVFACDTQRGNCTDYHSYFIALARAEGIPARFAIGASIPSSRNEGGISGYHCWAEFYTNGSWWPVDISEADKCSKLSTFFFGRHPANRIELSRGRDLLVEPSPESGPINFLAYPLLEVAGKPLKTKIDFSFRRLIDA